MITSGTMHTVCPYCEEQHSRATHPNEKPPKAGDLSICAKCGGLSKLGPSLKLLTLTQEEIVAAIAKDPRIRVLQAEIRRQKASPTSAEFVQRLFDDVLEKLDGAEKIGNRPAMMVTLTLSLLHLTVSKAPGEALPPLLEQVMETLRLASAARTDGCMILAEFGEGAPPSKTVN